MFVKYNPKQKHIKVIPLIPTGGSTTSFDNSTVTLRPGTNELTDKEWEAIKPHIKELIGNEIVPFTVEAKASKGGKGAKAKSLSDVPLTTARKIIQSCTDPKTLQKWFNQELPEEISLVLAKRMRQLKIEPKDLEDEAVLKDSDITPEDESDTTDDDENLDDDVKTRTDEGENEGGDDDLDDDLDIEENEDE